MSSNNKDITNVFIIIIVCVISILFGIFGYLSYNKSSESFIAFLGLIFLIYSSIGLIYTLLHKNEYSDIEFNINFGMDISIIIISIILCIYFGVKSFFVYSHHNNYSYRNNY